MADGSFDRGEFVGYFRDEALELLERIDSDLLKLETTMAQGACDYEAVNSIFRSLHTIKGSAGMLDFAHVHKLAHWLESAVDLVRSATIALDVTLLELTFTGRDLLGDLVSRAIIGDVEMPAEVQVYLGEIEHFIARASTAALAPSVEALSQISADEEAIAKFEAEIAQMLLDQVPEKSAAVPGPAPAMVVTAPARTEAPASTIRVALERLDLLLDLVGELVINRTRVSAISQSLGRALERELDSAPALLKDLANAASTLARITNELQETVMKARMVPVGQVFERFPRTVRDLAKTTGKQIQLSITGEETDLDKTIVDQIGEPLMHLVRNCVDHGIEMPEARMAAGKPAAGTIRLHAYHEGNQVIIEVGDDGNGISLENVRKRGVARGLIEANGIYSDEELIELIFAPGFSTVEKVTSLSGRGVGMDVVKKSVMDLKGQLDVETVPGRGSTFLMRLPLTLAIIRTLLVTVGPRLFAIPLDVVIESQRIANAEVRTIGGTAVVTMRGTVLPLVNLARIFGIAGAPPEDDHTMIVIVAHKGRRFGLVVDNFEGDQEIVIKPLAEILGPTEYIAGATILGNGTIALILDVGSLATSHSRIEHAHFEHANAVPLAMPTSQAVYS